LLLLSLLLLIILLSLNNLLFEYSFSILNLADVTSKILTVFKHIIVHFVHS
jgi:hypothetical protein